MLLLLRSTAESHAWVQAASTLVRLMGLLLGTKAPIVMSNGIDLDFVSFVAVRLPTCAVMKHLPCSAFLLGALAEQYTMFALPSSAMPLCVVLVTIWVTGQVLDNSSHTFHRLHAQKMNAE